MSAIIKNMWVEMQTLLLCWEGRPALQYQWWKKILTLQLVNTIMEINEFLQLQYILIATKKCSEMQVRVQANTFVPQQLHTAPEIKAV